MYSIEHRPSAHFEVANTKAPTSQVTKPTILVVEDDFGSLAALKGILSTKGYRVLEASDGEEALAVVETTKLDLILLDLQLPKLDGLVLIRHLREKRTFEDLPIVMMTGLKPEKSRGHAIAAGCDEVLSKPIDYDHLEAILDQLVPLRPVLL
jgi:DNA-binding response OmpR family regulator